jgi:hypothetical protein
MVDNESITANALGNHKITEMISMDTRWIKSLSDVFIRVLLDPRMDPRLKTAGLIALGNNNLGSLHFFSQ